MLRNPKKFDWLGFLTRQRSAPRRYLAAVFLIIASFFIVTFLNQISPGSHFYSIDLASTILATLYGGLGPGLLVAFSEAIFADYYFIEPTAAVFDSVPSFTRIVIDTAFAFLAAALTRKLRDVAADELSARREAEKEARARERVLAVVSHDLRNPLSAIRLNSAMIEKSSQNERLRHQAEIILRSSRQMDRLISDLLDATRIERGTFALEIRNNNIQTVISEAVETLLPQASEKQIRLEFRLQEPFPPVHFDHDRILQVLFNLLGNAIKFSPPGSTVTLATEQKDNEVTFHIMDQGPGIAPEDRERIFERFWQSKESAHLGTGLGLFITKSIVEGHGGRIWMDEHSGGGSTFHFSLPANQLVKKAA